MGLRRLNPFRGLPNPREVWAWGMYDLANQSFTLLINTMLFSVFFSKVIVTDAKRGELLWSRLYAGSLLLVVLASPIAGAIADHRSVKKKVLIGLGIACSVFTCLLGVLRPGMVWLAAAIYIPANFFFAIGENFLAAFLPEIARPHQMGRVSAIGWTMGYVGALILLVLALALMKFFGWEHESSWRPLLVLAGAWFLVMGIPTALFLKERPRRAPTADESGSLLAIGFARLAQTARHASRFRQLMRFLVIFFIYGMGVQIVVAFASIVARDYGFTGTELALFLLQLTVTAGASSVFAGMYQDRLGHKRTVLVFLLIWVVTAIGMAMLPNPAGGEGRKWMIWILGNGVGLGLGGIGTASRTMVGVFTPAHRTAEFFGLWGLSYKLAGVVGVASFGYIKSSIGNTASFVALAAVFVAGLIGLLFVDERSGQQAARDAEAVEGAALTDERDVAAAAASGIVTPPPS
ncbi:MAG: MFS transporter [Phycisphaerales bacterium]|nr:MFS transporter [Phycisphaerales bacterium]